MKKISDNIFQLSNGKLVCLDFIRSLDPPELVSKKSFSFLINYINGDKEKIIIDNNAFHQKATDQYNEKLRDILINQINSEEKVDRYLKLHADKDKFVEDQNFNKAAECKEEIEKIKKEFSLDTTHSFKDELQITLESEHSFFREAWIERMGVIAPELLKNLKF